MRTIKFRIYDKERQEWVHDTEHAINLFGETIILGEILRRLDDTDVSLEELNNLVPMQFTGLTDKNGKEIYEGDIVRLTLDRPNGIFKVIWDENKAQFSCQNKHVTYPLGLTLPVLREVIGNAWENPELLNKN